MTKFSKLLAGFCRVDESKKLLDVPLSRCVHYCGFRYGRQEYNPYETYQVDLYAGIPLTQVRRRFIQFLLSYRPRHFGEALGLQLSRPCALWAYPWDDITPGELTQHGWRSTPEECPDILTHFSESGIHSMRIDEEFLWLEKTLHSISHFGYQPEKFGPGQVLELRRRDNMTAYLLLDGNHRAGALSAVDCHKTLVTRCERSIREEEANSWPGVHKGWMNLNDALAIFHAYFRGNSEWKPSAQPAKIIAPTGWEDLYLT